MPQVMPKASARIETLMLFAISCSRTCACAPAEPILLRLLLLRHALRRIAEMIGKLRRQHRFLGLLIQRHGEAAEDHADDRDDTESTNAPNVPPERARETHA